MEKVETLPIKLFVITLHTAGKTIEEIIKESNVAQKIVLRWIAEFEELKEKRLDVLLNMLKIDSDAKEPFLTVWDRMIINQERSNLLKENTTFTYTQEGGKIKILFFDYPEPLLERINKIIKNDNIWLMKESE
ncbi:hypothetical protein HX049_05150 [Myroides odoratimimus]|uniref:hypothetical protein n=1 Tax=Myroides odoratimimus TaxID=76832 RepID=UPI002574AB60|nr:hypothetical protein [Myroides odoratimimus]MDM1396556.1 hypothetical protein [Myroides odoratimimus]